MNNLSRARRPVRDRTAPDRFNPSEETANSKERGRRAKEVANSKERGRQTPSHFKEGREPQRVKAKRSKYRLHRKTQTGCCYPGTSSGYTRRTGHSMWMHVVTTTEAISNRNVPNIGRKNEAVLHRIGMGNVFTAILRMRRNSWTPCSRNSEQQEQVTHPPLQRLFYQES